MMEMASTYRKKLRQRSNLLEVPNLLAFDEQFHGLFLEIRKMDGVKSFEAISLCSSEITLKIVFNEVLLLHPSTLPILYGLIHSMGYTEVVYKWSYRGNLVEIKIKKS